MISGLSSNLDISFGVKNPYISHEHALSRNNTGFPRKNSLSCAWGVKKPSQM
jgi:hypothetical protein